MRWFAAILGASSLLLSAAGGASGGDILIRPGVSIGKLRIGMKETEALRAYQYAYVELEDRPFGRERGELSFGLSPYSAVLFGPKGATRVVQITTFAASERTRENVGVGSTEARVMTVYGKRLACDKPTAYEQGGMVYYGDTRACYLRARGVETVFASQMIVQERGIVQFIRRWIPKQAHVRSVTVRTLPAPRA